MQWNCDNVNLNQRHKSNERNKKTITNIYENGAQMIDLAILRFDLIVNKWIRKRRFWQLFSHMYTNK